MNAAEYALSFARGGWGVFPVWSSVSGRCKCPRGDACESPGKHPMTLDGFKSATTDADKIKTFMAAKSKPNYGMVPPEHVVALDVDGDDVARLAELESKLGPLPETMQTVTANGRHIMLQLNGADPGGQLHGFVTRRHGDGYIIGPGSVHPSGAIYKWNGIRDVAPMPAAWVPKSISLKVATSEGSRVDTRDPLPEPGHRHAWLVKKARHLAGYVRDADELWRLMLAENARLAEPKSEEAVQRAIGDVLTKFGPDEPPLSPDRGSPAGHRTMRTTRASSISPRPVHWLWKDRVPCGSLALLGGREGIGKSVVECDVVARITRGILPGRFQGTPRDVLIVAAEDSWAHTIVPRLMAADADLDRVHRVDVVTSEGIDVEISLPADNIRLEQTILELDAALVCLDPLISRLDTSLDTHKDAEVRKGLEPLVKIADRTGATFLGLIHVNKSRAADDPLSTLMASRAFAAVPRAVLYMVNDPDDDNGRLLGQAKNNLGRMDLPTLKLHIEGAMVAETDDGEVWTGRAVWDGDSETSINDAVNAASDGVSRSAVGEAADWLDDYLRDGPVKRVDIINAGHKAGHNESAIKRAAGKLKVVKTNEGFPRITWWALPIRIKAPPQSGRGDSAPVGSKSGESGLTELTGLTVSQLGPVGSVGSVGSRTTEAGPTGDLTASAAAIFGELMPEVSA